MIKNSKEIELMRFSGALLARVFNMLDGVVKPGMSTMEINDITHQYIEDDLVSRPASLGQYGYKYVLNSSINEVVCHGMPSTSDILKDSDIVNLDITLEKDGFITDSSKMYVMPNAPQNARDISQAAYDAMYKGIEVVKEGAYLGDVGYAIQKYTESLGYSVVREYCGHGIGRKMHEEPQILHYGQRNAGLCLKAGMTFTIEPMINEGKKRTKDLKDGWTVVTHDGKLSAQSEHTILVTKTGYEILTLRKEEKDL